MQLHDGFGSGPLLFLGSSSPLHRGLLKGLHPDQFRLQSLHLLSDPAGIPTKLSHLEGNSGKSQLTGRPMTKIDIPRRVDEEHPMCLSAPSAHLIVSMGHLCHLLLMLGQHGLDLVLEARCLSLEPLLLVLPPPSLGIKQRFCPL